MDYVIWIAIIYLILINILTFIAFGVDKSRARNHAWRTPEKRLFFLAVIVAVNFIMRSAGVKVDYDISEIIYVLPRIPCVIFSVAFAFITGIYAWKKCLYLYRYDIQGQKTIKPQGNRTSKFLPLKERKINS